MVNTVDREARLRVSDDEFLERFPLRVVSVPELVPEYPEYEKKAIRRRCWWLHKANKLSLIDGGKGNSRHFFLKVVGDQDPSGIDPSRYSLAEQSLQQIIKDLALRGASGGTALWVIRSLIPEYIETIALRGVTTAEIRTALKLDVKAIAYLDPGSAIDLSKSTSLLDPANVLDLGQEAVDQLVDTSIYISGRQRWYLALSPLIGFTVDGKPFYKGTSLPPRWIESDGMC